MGLPDNDLVFPIYGTKFIQLLAEKYGGEMKCVTKDNVFCLDVIFGIDK